MHPTATTTATHSPSDISASAPITEQVATIISQVRNDGDKALKALSQKYDKAAPDSVLVTKHRLTRLVQGSITKSNKQ